MAHTPTDSGAATAACYALAEVLSSRPHQIHLLPAYDVAGKLIPAAASFHLPHASFKNFNSFTANVHSTRVIKVPPPPANMLAKQLLAKTFKDPLLSTEGKRARRN